MTDQYDKAADDILDAIDREVTRNTGKAVNWRPYIDPKLPARRIIGQSIADHLRRAQ